jgi:putative membrane protein
MKQFNQEFKTKLWQTIADIENNSLVEIVVIMKQRSASYTDIALLCGCCFGFILFTSFIFLPTLFGDLMIYFGTITSFAVGYLLASFFPSFERILIPKNRLQKYVEIMARAIFQKAGMHHTNQKIGVLFYISMFEKMVYILPDRGAEQAVPHEEWINLKDKFQKMFQANEPADYLLNELKATQEFFNKYIPPIENDINEIPDNIDVDF